MNNFIYENKTKVYFGKGGVKEYLGVPAGPLRQHRHAGLRRRLRQAQRRV